MKIKKIYLLLCTMLCGVVAATALGPSALRAVSSGQTRGGDEYPVYNETTETGYDDLETAIDEAESGNIITITGSHDITKEHVITSKTLTLKGTDGGDAKLIRKTNSRMFKTSDTSAILTLENLIIDGSEVTSPDSKSVMLSSDAGTMNLNDVTLASCVSTYERGLIFAKGTVNAYNLKIENSSVPAGRGEIFVGDNKLNISGNCAISSIYAEKSCRVNITNLNNISQNLTGDSPIRLYVDDNRAENTLLVNGYTHSKDGDFDTNYIDPTLFIVEKEGYSLAVNSNTGKDKEALYTSVTEIKNKPLYLQTTINGKEYIYGFIEFHAAHSSTASNDIIVLNEDVKVTHRVSPAGKGVTIKSADPENPKTITCSGDFTFFLSNGNTGYIYFEDVILDGDGNNWNTTVLEASGPMSLKNVKIQNYNTTNTQGLICIKGSGKVIAENLVIDKETCSVPENKGLIYVADGKHLEMMGDCCFSVNLEKNGQIDVVGDLTNTEAIPVIVDETRKNTTIVNGCGDTSKFAVNCIEDFALAATSDGNNLELLTTIVVNPEDSPVVNRTIEPNRGYDDLTSAFTAANAGDLIVVKEDQTTTDRLSGKSVTIKGENSSKPVTIKCTKDNIFFIANSSDGPLTFENIILDGSENSAWSKVMLEGNGADLVLNDVVIRNYNASSNSVINLKDNNKLTARNLVIEDCTVPTNSGYISVGKNKNLEISGKCQFSALLNGSSQIEVKDNLDDDALIEVIVADSREDSNIVIGCEDASKFILTIPGSEKELKLEPAEGNLKLVSEVVEDPSTKPVYNQTSGTGFANIASAISEAETGAVLILNENQTIDSRITLGAKKLTIKGNGKTISRGENLSEILLLVNNADGELDLENVTIDGIGKEVSKAAIEASGKGIVNLSDVTFSNCNIKEGNLISVKSGGHVSVNNVKTISCSIPEGTGDIFIGNSCSLDMAGNNDFTVTIEVNGHINASELTNTNPVKIYLTAIPEENTLLVSGCEDISKFSIEADGCKLIAQDGNIMVEIPVVEGPGEEDPENPDDPNKEDPENPDDPNKEDPENPDDPNKEDPENPDEPGKEDPVNPDEPGKEDPVEETKAVYNSTSKKGFDTLELAFAAAQTGDEIIVKEDQKISNRLGGKNVTIKGENVDKTVSITSEKDIIYFLAGTNEGPLKLENLVIDGGNTEWSTTAFEANGGELALKNVSIRNYKTTNRQGVISVKSSSNSKLMAENLVIESSCSVPSDVAQIFLGNGKHLELACGGNFSVNIEGSGVIDVTGTLSNETSVGVLVDPARANKVIVTDCDDLSKFTILNEGCTLVANEGNIEVFVPEEENPGEGDDPVDPVDPNSVPVYNETTGKGYDTLSEAFAAAKTGAVLILNEDQTVAERLSTDTREITILSDDNVTISRDKGYNGMLFLVNANGGVLSMENVIIDGADVESKNVVVEASGKGVVNFTDVTLRNCVTTADQGIICVKSGGHIYAENLVIESSTTAADRGEVYVGTNSSLTITGNCQISIMHQGNGSIDATDATHTTPLDLHLDGEYEDGTVIVKGCSDPNMFNLVTEGYIIVPNGGNIVVKKSGYSNIGEIEFDADEEDVEYYTLQGQRVKHPSTGFYVRRKGNEVTKVYVK